MQYLSVVGGRRLEGRVTVAGSNSAGLALLSATLLTPAEITLTGLSPTAELQTHAAAIHSLGCPVVAVSGGWRVAGVDSPPQWTRLVNTPWSVMLLLGPALARFGVVELPLPPNAPFGPRPIDLYIKVLRSFGVEVNVGAGALRANAKAWRAGEVVLDVPSFGATWTAVALATQVPGRSIITGCSRAPEVVDAVNLLNQMGARVSGAGTEVITVHGGFPLAGASHEVIPDRIQAGFLLLVAAATGGEVEVAGVITQHLRMVLAALNDAGADIEERDDSVVLRVRRPLMPITLRTGFYPGFPSHLQPAACSMLLAAQGTSAVTETLYQDRLFHLDELRRMGAQLSRDGQLGLLHGGRPLSPARLVARDAGSAAGLLVAALMANGASVIENAGYLREWFADPVALLKQLGAEVSCGSSETAVAS